MGRTSLAAERRSQCLDAFERCIIESGYPNASLERVAAEAGVHRTIIRHYFGGRDGLVDALLARLEQRYRDRYATSSDDSATHRLDAILDEMFAPYRDGQPTIDRVFDGLYAAASSDLRIQRFVHRFYRTAEERLIGLIAVAHPHAPTARHHDVAASVLALAVGHSVLESVDPSADRATRLQSTAAALVASVET